MNGHYEGEPVGTFDPDAAEALRNIMDKRKTTFVPEEPYALSVYPREVCVLLCWGDSTITRCTDHTGTGDFEDMTGLQRTIMATRLRIIAEMMDPR